MSNIPQTSRKLRNAIPRNDILHSKNAGLILSHLLHTWHKKNKLLTHVNNEEWNGSVFLPETNKLYHTELYEDSTSTLTHYTIVAGQAMS